VDRAYLNGQTHLIGGVTAGLITATLLSNDTALQVTTGVIAAAAGGLAPDWLSISIPLVKIPYVEGHRSVLTHSLLASAFMCLLLFNAFGIEHIGVYFAMGMVSHQLLDLPTGNGIPIFFPIRLKRTALNWGNNGGRMEQSFQYGLLAVCCSILVYWFFILVR
jgi:inner membrane protein